MPPMCCSAILAECPNSVTLIRMAGRLHWLAMLLLRLAPRPCDARYQFRECDPKTDHSCQTIRTEGSSQQTYGLSLSMTRSNIALTLFDSFRIWIMWIRYSDGNRTPLIQNLRQIGCIVGLFRNVRRIFCGFPGCFLYDQRVAIDEKEEWKRKRKEERKDSTGRRSIGGRDKQWKQSEDRWKQKHVREIRLALLFCSTTWEPIMFQRTHCLH